VKSGSFTDGADGKGVAFMRYSKAMTLLIRAAAIFLLFANGFSTGEVLKVAPDKFDFGAIEEGKAAVVTATIENTGSVRVEITNVRTS
jgi:membrane protein YqaA with SNARE-associated domain